VLRVHTGSDSPAEVSGDGCGHAGCAGEV
jgi:hypothetical protein